MRFRMDKTDLLDSRAATREQDDGWSWPGDGEPRVLPGYSKYRGVHNLVADTGRRPFAVAEFL
jgi:hypothetical protein